MRPELHPVPYRRKILQLQVGDAVLRRNEFVATKPMAYVSAGVRGFTGCPLNHTALVSMNSAGVLMLNEALAEGVVSRPLLEVLERPDSRIVIRRDPRTIDPLQFAIRANNKIGTPYDFANLLDHQVVYRSVIMAGKALDWATAGNLILKPNWAWFGKTGMEAAGRLQCAEYYAWAWQRSNFWLYSTREIFQDGMLQTVYDELSNP